MCVCLWDYVYRWQKFVRLTNNYNWFICILIYWFVFVTSIVIHCCKLLSLYEGFLMLSFSCRCFIHCAVLTSLWKFDGLVLKTAHSLGTGKNINGK